jgi:RNA polymerase sigma factor (sigma-70 family)
VARMQTNDAERAGVDVSDASGAPLTTTTAGTEELVLRFQAGDEHALERLWTRYLPRLKRWAHGRLPTASRNVTNTDDLVQDAFVRSVARLRTLKPQGPHSLFAYFRTIMLNQIRDYARQGVRRPRQEELMPEEHVVGDPSPLEQVLGQEVLERYEAALATLGEEDQELILAFVELRCSDRELAELFEKSSVDAARMARGRALARLARAMGVAEGGKAAPPVRNPPDGRS